MASCQAGERIREAGRQREYIEEEIWEEKEPENKERRTLGASHIATQSSPKSKSKSKIYRRKEKSTKARCRQYNLKSRVMSKTTPS